MIYRLLGDAMIAAFIVAVVGLYHFAVALVAWGGSLAALTFIGGCLLVGHWIEARARRQN